MDNAVYNESGKVVLRYYQPSPKLIKVGGQDVYFDAQHAISLAFVDEALVPQMLAYKGGCCGKSQQVIFLATQTQYQHWLDGQGGR